MKAPAKVLRAAVAAIGALSSIVATPAAAAGWGRGYVPNVPVVSQHGKVFNFYDDLIRDKIFVISFFYASCSQICPLATARLSELQALLGDSVGREIFFYTIVSTRKTTRPSV